MNEKMESWLQWLVTINNVRDLWEAQPTYILVQLVFMLSGLLTIIHAFRQGGRWPWLWFATVMHGLFTDNFWHIIVPEYDNFWHSQTPVMFLGARQPLHIIILYPVFLYNAAYAVSKLNLGAYVEPFAVGLVTVLIDVPYDIVSVKFVHWTWHDTDPNVFDRHYWVPWNSYYFHAAFAASFAFFFHASRKWFAPKKPKWESAGYKTELKSLIAASLLGMPGGVLMFIPFYHPLHDTMGIHSEVTYFLLFSIFGAIVLGGLISERETLKNRLSKMDYLMLVQLVVHYTIYWAIVVFGSPENERSVGLHEPVGPCNETTSLVTPFGQTLSKRKYLCVSDYDEGYFDFHCVGGVPPPAGSTWYTICGTPFANRAEYVTIITSILIMAGGVFHGLYFKTLRNRKSKVQ